MTPCGSAISEPCSEGHADCPTDVLSAVSQSRLKETGADEFVDIALMDLMIDHEKPRASPAPMAALPHGIGSESAGAHREVIRAVFHHTVIVVIVHWRHAAPEIEKPLAA